MATIRELGIFINPEEVQTHGDGIVGVYTTDSGRKTVIVTLDPDGIDRCAGMPVTQTIVDELQQKKA